jgi:putative holliday junction resolvase
MSRGDDRAAALPLEGRLLAIDLGEVRIGLALSDPTQTIASPAETLHVPRGQDGPTLDALVDAIARHGAAGVVLGEPRRLDGRQGAGAARAQRFAEELATRTELPAVLWDERFTTAEAERVLLEGDVSRRGRKGVVDQLAASLLLQAVLTVQSRRREAAKAAGAEGSDEGSDEPVPVAVDEVAGEVAGEVVDRRGA